MQFFIIIKMYFFGAFTSRSFLLVSDKENPDLLCDRDFLMCIDPEKPLGSLFYNLGFPQNETKANGCLIFL